MVKSDLPDDIPAELRAVLSASRACMAAADELCEMNNAEFIAPLRRAVVRLALALAKVPADVRKELPNHLFVLHRSRQLMDGADSALKGRHHE